MSKNNSNNIAAHFKPYVSVKNTYKGGKGIIPKNSNQKVFKLSSNENPIGTSPMAINAIKNNLNNLHIYPDTTDIQLRKALEKHYNYNLNLDQFVCASSGSELLDLIIRGFVREGDEVIISTPCFVPYQMFSRWSGAKIIDVPLLSENYILDIDGIVQKISNKTRIIFLTSPNNPTGTYIPKELFENFMDKIPSDIVVVFDEVYWHFAEAEDYIRPLTYINKYPNIVAINSFSKTYGLASLRVGYSYMQVEIANYLRQICKPFLISKLSLEAAIAALKDVQFVEKTVHTITEERKFLMKNFDKLGITYVPSQANFFLINPPVSVKNVVNYLGEEGIAVRPVDNFGAKGKIRISIGDREANKALIKAFEKILKLEVVTT